MTESASAARAASEAVVELDRDVFMRSLIRELAGTLENVVGLDEAAGFVSIVGQHMGRQIDATYRAALGADRFDREQVAAVLVDLKRRIHGGFSIAAQDDSRIVFDNTACPFAEKVLGRPAMCMMTSNVFGVIAAEHLGYARVELQRTIAEGHGGCRVVVHLKEDQPTGAPTGREYFRTTPET
jgi:predicted ArsR family transcriptional regulator